MRSECGKCGLAFSSVQAFDNHRVGGYGDPITIKGKTVGYTKSERRCLTIEGMQAKGMALTQKGIWGTGKPYHFPEKASPLPEESEISV